jgi:hypothetical protein
MYLSVMQGTSSVMSLRGTGSDTLRVKVGSTDVVVRIALVNTFGYSYRCEVNGSIIKEANEELPDETLPTYDMSIPTTQVVSQVTDGKTESVVIYNIESVRSVDGRVARKSRRFKDFFDLQEDVSSAFVGNHLSNSLPRLPRRGVKIISDHLDPLFVEGRRMELQSFLRSLVKIPRVSNNPEFLQFIGMLDSDSTSSPTKGDTFVRVDAGVRDKTLTQADFQEYSTTFQEGSLGMTLKSTTVSFGVAMIDCFNDNDDGSMGQAERNGEVAPGDIVSRVNGVSVTSCSYSEVISQIGKATRPLTLHLLRRRASYVPKPRLSQFLAPADVSSGGGKRASVPAVGEEEGLFS